MRCWGFSRNLHRCKREGAWVLYCYEHRRQWIQLLIAVVFTIGGGTASIWAVLRSQTGDEEALRAEAVNNLRTLVEKLRVADRTYEWMVKREQLIDRATPTVVPPTPYRDLGERLSRDLPKFKATYSAALITERWGKKQPFYIYAKVYQAFESVEDQERSAIRFLHSSWETWEDIGVVAIGKIRIYGIVLTNLLKQYLLCFIEAHGYLKQAGVGQLPDVSEGLYFLEEIKREKNAAAGKKD